MATQGQALKAYTALMGMGRKAVGKAAFSLFRMKQQLKTVIDFQAEQEQAMVERHGGQITEDGKILFAEVEQRKAFAKERAELERMEIDPEIPEITMKAKDIPDICMDEIEALEGFIKFEEE
jgi:hypothetical protein